VQVHVAAVEYGAPERPRATHALTAYGSDRPGIVAALTALLADRGVNITDLSCRRTGGPQPLYAMVAELAVPDGLDVSELEAAVRAAADDLGIDVRLEPVEVETL
jgi:glycine cleavage system transcriptional repressor